MAKEESVYVYRNVEGFEPVMLLVRDDCSFREVKTTCPCGRFGNPHLEVIGHTPNEVCFKHSANHEVYVWGVGEKEKVETINYNEDGLEGVYGFGRTREGEAKIVRWMRPSVASFSRGRPVYDQCVWVYQSRAWRLIKETSLNPFKPEKGRLVELAAQHLYFLGRRSDRKMMIMGYDLETDQQRELALPPVALEESSFLDGITLGHGLRGELSACMFLPVNTRRPSGMIRIWSLRQGLWQLIGNLRPHIAPTLRKLPFVPVFFFIGRDDRLLNLVLLKEGNQIVIYTRQAGLNFQTTVVFAQDFSNPPRLSPSAVGSKFYTYDKGPNAGGNKRQRPDEDIREERQQGKKRGGVMSLEYMDDPQQA